MSDQSPMMDVRAALARIEARIEARMDRQEAAQAALQASIHALLAILTPAEAPHPLETAISGVYGRGTFTSLDVLTKAAEIRAAADRAG